MQHMYTVSLRTKCNMQHAGTLPTKFRIAQDHHEPVLRQNRSPPSRWVPKLGICATTIAVDLTWWGTITTTGKHINAARLLALSRHNYVVITASPRVASSAVLLRSAICRATSALQYSAALVQPDG